MKPLLYNFVLLSASIKVFLLKKLKGEIFVRFTLDFDGDRTVYKCKDNATLSSDAKIKQRGTVQTRIDQASTILDFNFC